MTTENHNLPFTLATGDELSKLIKSVGTKDRNNNKSRHRAFVSAIACCVHDDPDKRDPRHLLDAMRIGVGTARGAAVNAWLRHFTGGALGVAYDSKKGAWRTVGLSKCEPDKINIAGLAGTPFWEFKAPTVDHGDKTLEDLKKRLEAVTADRAAWTENAKHAANRLLDFADRSGLFVVK
jgi:hypothetical protein